MTIVFIRHGTAYGTEQGLCQGQSLCEGLTPKGHTEIYKCSEVISTRFKPGWIFSSPIKRAYESACILGEAFALEPVSIEDLRERNYGLWEGRLFEDVRDRLNARETPPYGETHSEFCLRAHMAIQKILENYQNALIVSHGGIWQALHDYHHREAPWIYPGQAFQIEWIRGSQSFESSPVDYLL